MILKPIIALNYKIENNFSRISLNAIGRMKNVYMELLKYANI